MKNKTYLDYNATAPLRPECLARMNALLSEPHNASSVHSYGREGRKALEEAREDVAALVGAPTAQVIFNSGATEGNNTVLNHFRDERVLVSAIEHPSALDVLPNAEKIPVTSGGIVDLDALGDLLKAQKTALISVMAVNNETGVIQPVQKISALSRQYGALFHCDAVQATGRMPLNIAQLGIDFLTLSSHKIGGPQGAGALVLGLCGITPTLLRGGGQEKYARAGTENIAAISGFGLAAKAALRDLEKFQTLATLRDHLETEIMKTPGVIIHGKNSPRAANTSLFSIHGLLSETLMMAFDLEGIALSNGSACSSGRVEASSALKAMGVDAHTAAGTLRVSMGWATVHNDIDAFLAAWSKIILRLQDKIRAHG